MRRKGFTIVELLIVIVVIAILAAITIVAYNGIQNRAKASAAQAAASQAARKIALYAVEHNDQYPTSLEEAGIANTQGLQYSGGGSSFCVTATEQSVSYFQSNSAQAVAGACPGHGANGATAITNLVTNPSFEVNTSGWTFNTPALQNGAAGSGSNPASGNQGSKSLRFTFSAPGTMSGFGPYTTVNNLDATKQYVLSIWVRSNKPVSYAIIAERRNSAGTNIGSLGSGNTTLVANTWTRLQLTIPVTPNMDRLTFTSYGNYSAIAANDWIEWDGAMATEGGTLYEYADGASSNWVWTGTPHLSTSKGSPL